MASIDDLFGEIHSVNVNLNVIQNELSDLKAGLGLLRSTDQQGLAEITKTLNDGFVNLSQGISAVIQLQTFIGTSLAHQSKQNDTMICILENISRNTCSIYDETHRQTSLQTKMSEDVRELTEMFKSAHPQAALELARQESLEQEIRACCPDQKELSPCLYEPCPPPDDTQPSVPEVNYEPYEPGTQPPVK